MAKKHWHKIWSGHDVDVSADEQRLKKELDTIRWREMSKIIIKQFGSFKNKKTIEVGSGLGDFSLLMAWEGANPTLADYSKEALKKAETRFKAHDQKAKYKLADMLDVPRDLQGKFDVSFSLGVAEHFDGDQRFKIVEAHQKVLKKGGLTFISVPYRASAVYRIWMWRCIKRGDWPYGLEIPFTKTEIRKLAKDSGLAEVAIIQSSFWSDLNTFFPFLRIKRFFPNKLEKKSFFDKWAYALVYVGKRED